MCCAFSSCRGFQFGGSLDERLRSVAIGEDQDAGGTIRIRERERVLNGKIGPCQRAVSRKDRRIAPSLLEDFGGVVDEEELVFARWFRAAQKFLPLGEAFGDEVFGRIGAIKDGDTFRGNRTRVKVVKNKVAAPFRQAEFDIIFNEGISYIGDLLDIGVEQEIVKRSGAWYSFEEVRIGQGRDRTVQFLDENTDILEKIETQVRAELGL